MDMFAQMPVGTSLLSVFAAILLTLVAHIIARILAKKVAGLPVIVAASVLVITFLYLFNWDYGQYYSVAKPVFDHLLGYVTVLLAIPLATMNFKGLALKKLTIIVIIASVIGALMPMLMAVGFSLSQDVVLAFASRSVTTPIGLSIAEIIQAPLAMANLIIIVSGIIGASVARILLRHIDDHKAKGLALGLAAHAFGTVEAWQISPVAGRYAAFGLAINGLTTAIWLPVFLSYILSL